MHIKRATGGYRLCDVSSGVVDCLRFLDNNNKGLKYG
jgi:hypothetical protein